MRYGLYDSKHSSPLVQLFRQTFSDSKGNEEGVLIGSLVEQLLRTTESDDISVFIATEGSSENIVGSIFFTRLTFDSKQNIFLLAPVAIKTSYQGLGIGQELIRFGLQTLRHNGVELVFTYGDPAFYTKVGFKQVTEEQFHAPLPLSYPHGWMAHALNKQNLSSIAGPSSCVPAFHNPALW